ncbi:Asp-tRNA(Asn)/Glu-tRNA(Gln) amidotransferase subunit GatC [Microbulbifer thermotolerans]|uniref:Asp-tRNA(Asn)/Glu-tRNA(Gln) amidotransferase subunit GatC n=1 Tax=Microbulbifer thermotolerans TaxID=252514 RepID=UPI0008F1F827|nr:Asp-tRNA(Asn)/Glu-tRNA(Gln) amidotransferase subunit GatC [Microbulbifer thermotolerans]MCX2780583.1 Asp-tRNA(Asn)/Glu-tRNA(Gln) amidotransferase subunit GatC [Microbulbifer thermotolerans]MCX2783120.1 Asp-tRNA(Asn)/Glu-tRNA(Gln) amidotransferase subunit GatC [Microbulbifer thermotolerans]MCX2794278.1 Asp-tRNA(Asn)/Glu-tRNA(Gln) amidotransferase subunit GatC [Microbulbifer thermotolerans]MCX2803487.1 Asp-tRNA(Asn)/Glu-tRNA(Gln) amidotransferase subunit GatC [Microbulbifer thermotolerans]MCX
MAVDTQTVEKLAELARIAISAETIDEVSNRLGDVLQLVDQLQAVHTEGVAPMAHPLDEVQVLRADEVTEPNRREEFLALAPQSEAGLYLVPKVID